MIFFKINWPKLLGNLVSITVNTAHKLKGVKQKLGELTKKFPELPKGGDVYEDPKHAATPGGMIENSLDPLKFDPSRKLKKKPVKEYVKEAVDEAVKEEAEKTVEDIKKAVDEAVPDDVETKKEKSFLDKLADKADELVKSAKEAQEKK